MKATATNTPGLLTNLLRSVSRSFYTTLRVLPGSVRSQIGLAYLLARAADTIADTDIVPVQERLNALRLFREKLLTRHRNSLDFGSLVSGQALPAERTLLERLPEAWSVLDQFGSADQELVRQVLVTITSGQELDLQRFGVAGAVGCVLALERDSELDDYTYRVAGCVGEFWTRICRSHLFPATKLDDLVLIRDGVRFGKGLQLVNILRDLPKDLRQGRCYLPQELLVRFGLAPADLLSAKTEPRFRPLYNQYLDQAEAHLSAGWDYTTMLPSGQIRVRLACAWPLLIGIRTIARLRSANVLDAEKRVKVPRNEVRNLVLRSVILYPFSGIWNGQFNAARDKVVKPVASQERFE